MAEPIHLQLQPNDLRVGTYNPDGSIATWPRTDVHGASYEKPNATVRRIDDDYFVVLGIQRDHEDHDITIVAPSTPSPRGSKASVPSPESSS